MLLCPTLLLLMLKPNQPDDRVIISSHEASAGYGLLQLYLLCFIPSHTEIYHES